MTNKQKRILFTRICMSEQVDPERLQEQVDWAVQWRKSVELHTTIGNTDTFRNKRDITQWSREHAQAIGFGLIHDGMIAKLVGKYGQYCLLSLA